MSDLNKYIPIVEGAIQLLGINPHDARTETFGSWSFKRGSARIQMFLRESKSHVGQRNALVITSDLMLIPKEPEKQMELYKTLLEYNYRFVSESFSVYDDIVTLSTARYADGMDQGEVVALLDSLSFIADSLDDQLIAQFSS